MTVIKKSSSPETAQARYVNKRGEQCPSCGSADLWKAEPLEAEHGVAHRDAECKKCGATWVEQFQVVAFANFTSNSKAARRRARRLQRRLLKKGRS